jgi:hypothetical protein
MNIADLQQAIGAAPDGIWGPKSKAALLAHFTNREANALTEADFTAAASRLGCSVRQIKAVRQIEAARSGFDRSGLPKILYERHRFHRLTGGHWSPSSFSMAQAGGYSIDDDHTGVGDSWDRLSAAIATGAVDAAFQSCSWGAFQVMGDWWDELEYPSPYALAWTCAQSEGDQLELFIRYVEFNHLTEALRRIDADPANCVSFASLYNGPAFRKFSYDRKLAEAMA